jgi:hypothetical protein
MFTNFDADCFYVADRSALIRALSILPEYLRNAATADGAVIDYRDWQVPLGRRFRALKLWFILRAYGREGLTAVIRSHIAMAREFANWVDADPHFERTAPAPFSVVNFRYNASDDENRAILAFSESSLIPVDAAGARGVTGSDSLGPEKSNSESGPLVNLDSVAHLRVSRWKAGMWPVGAWVTKVLTVNNLGLQIRYRYEIGPLSELFLVYARGGFDLLRDDEHSVGELFGHMSDVRDADQFMIKMRYRL